MKDEKFPFIVIEGIDGVGKTTCAKMLVEKLHGRYYKTPSGIYEKIRGKIEAEGNRQARFAFYLSSVIYASEEIRRIILSKPVVCDRYIFSTIAYHLALGVDLSYICIDKIPILFPDVCFYLYADEGICKQRIDGRGAYSASDKAIEKDKNLQRKIHRKFLKFPVIRIDTSCLRPEDVCEKILHQI